MKAILVATIFVSALSWGSRPGDILGIWHTVGKESQIEIYRCARQEEPDRFCGKITDIEEKIYPSDDKRGMGGKPKVDRENPDSSLRERPILGLQIMQGFRFNGRIWADGEIYDPESGKTYRCKLTLVDEKTLKVRGYIGISLLGRTETWTRF